MTTLLSPERTPALTPASVDADQNPANATQLTPDQLYASGLIAGRLYPTWFDVGSCDYLPDHGGLQREEAEARLGETADPVERASVMRATASLRVATLSTVQHDGSYSPLCHLDQATRSDDVIKLLTQQPEQITYEPSPSASYDLLWARCGSESRTAFLAVSAPILRIVEAGVRIRRAAEQGEWQADRKLRLRYLSCFAVEADTAALLESERGTNGHLSRQAVAEAGGYIAEAKTNELIPIATGLVAVQSLVNRRPVN